MSDQKIKHILKQETEIPDIVQKKAYEALSSIMMAKEKSSSYIGAEYKNSANKIRGISRYMKAAVIGFAVLTGVGTSVYAAGKYFDLFDFFADSGFTETTEMENLMDQNVSGIQFSNSYVDYTVCEAVSDDNLIYMVVEAEPKSEEYLLIPQDSMEEDEVTSLEIENVTDGTIGEYAASLGKKPVNVGITLFHEGDLVSCSVANKINVDGTIYFCLTGTNDFGAGDIDLTCVGTAFAKGMETADRAEQDCTVANYSSGTSSPYKIKDDNMEKDTGLVIDDVNVTETDLGLYVELRYHAADSMTDDIADDATDESADSVIDDVADDTIDDTAENAIYDFSIQLADSDGNELASMPYYASSGVEFIAEEDVYVTTVAYQKTEQQGLYLRVYNFMTNEAYGPYEIVEK